MRVKEKLIKRHPDYPPASSDVTTIYTNINLGTVVRNVTAVTSVCAVCRSPTCQGGLGRDEVSRLHSFRYSGLHRLVL